MKKLIIYGTTFNPMIHESVAGVIELYLDKKDAEMALEFEKAEYYKSEEREPSNFERWSVLEYVLNGNDSIVDLINGIGNIAHKLSGRYPEKK
jgi:hypothetical protein